MNNKYYCVSGIVTIDSKILFDSSHLWNSKRQNTNTGRFCKEKEMPEKAIEREIFEETGVTSKVNSILSVQFKPEQWCIIFLMDYICGTPHSDNLENSEVLLLSAEEAVKRSDITNLSKRIMETIIIMIFQR